MTQTTYNNKLLSLDDIYLEKLLLATPNGFCAGVEVAERAAHLTIDVMDEMKTLDILDSGAKLYLKHQIVHNNLVVKKLLDRNAIIMEDLNDVPDNSFVFFSAHGSSLKDYEIAKNKNLTVIDGTCGLVTKVHKAMIHYANNCDLIYIGNKNHIETIGAIGQLPKKNIPIIYTSSEAAALDVSKMVDPIFVTQTTLSVDDTKEIINILLSKGVRAPSSETICYATTNRQEAVKLLLKNGCDMILIVGSKESSNANKLVKTSLNMGVDAYLAEQLDDVKYNWFRKYNWLNSKAKLGISSAASTPQESLNEIVNFFKERSNNYSVVSYVDENIKFNIPKSLKDLITSHVELYNKFGRYL